MSGNNYRSHPVLGDVTDTELSFVVKVDEASLKAHWFNAGFLEGVIHEGEKRKLSQVGNFKKQTFDNNMTLRFCIYWFNKGRFYSKLWISTCRQRG